MSKLPVESEWEWKREDGSIIVSPGAGDHIDLSVDGGDTWDALSRDEALEVAAVIMRWASCATCGDVGVVGNGNAMFPEPCPDCQGTAKAGQDELMLDIKCAAYEAKVREMEGCESKSDA